MKYEGRHELEDLPVKPGDRVRIKKGTPVGHPIKNRYKGRYKAKKTYVIEIDHITLGHSHQWEHRRQNPEVVWSGAGGYWCRADINDVEIL